MNRRNRILRRAAGWTALLILAGACDNTVFQHAWLQFHGDGGNQGYIAINTSKDRKLKWSVDLGDVVRFSSIVCNPSGGIYVAVDSRLVKVSEAGQILWQYDFKPAYAVSTPALALDGRVYVVSIQELGGENYSNTLHCISASGSLQWSRNFAGIKAAPACGAPKIWQRAREGAVFVYANEMLYAFSLDGRLPDGEHDGHHCTVIYGTSWFWNMILAIWDAIKNGHPTSFPVDGFNYYATLAWPDPTLAVVDYEGSLYEAEPLVVSADFCGMTGFRWDPADETLSVVWHYNRAEAARLATPAVSAAGTLATAYKSGESGVFQFFDIFHDPARPTLVTETNIRDAFNGSPASIWMGAYFYFAGQRRLYRFDSMGQLASSAALQGQAYSSPACSQNWIFVSTTAGLEVFDPALEQHSVIPLEAIDAAVSAPAIDGKGTIYFMDQMGRLNAI